MTRTVLRRVGRELALALGMGITRHAVPAWDGARVHLEQMGAALAVCDERGIVVGLTPGAQRLLRSAGVELGELPARLPPKLWHDLSECPLGHAVEWRSERPDAVVVLGVTRYELGGSHFALWMREISEMKLELLRRIHQHRLEAIGRLVALIAHDLRTPLANMAISIEFLASRRDCLTPEVVDRIVDGLREGSKGLRWAVDGLLEFARLAPSAAVTVDLGDCLARVRELARSLLRDRSHRVVCSADARARRVRANAHVVEHILANLVLNAAEASADGDVIAIEAELDAAAFDRVRVRVKDAGTGIPPALRERVFEPFFTTKPGGAGIGLTAARDAARELGGDLVLEDSDEGASFALLLPSASR